MEPASRQLQLLLRRLCALLAVFSVSRSSVSAIRFEGNFTGTNTGCTNFAVEKTCVLPILSDNSDFLNYKPGYKLAFFNHLVQSDEYTLSIVLTAYPNLAPHYQRSVWSANRNRSVPVGAQFTFVQNGSLVLYDSNGSGVWSSQTDNMGAIGLDLNSTSGELILYGAQNETLWSSFSHPTDTIVAGQQLVWPGMQLVSSSSSTNNSEGAYSLVMEPAGLVLYASLSANPQPYFVWNYFAQSEEAMPVSTLQTTCGNPVTLELSGNGQLSLSNSSLNSNPVSTKSQAVCNLTPKYSSIQMNSYPNTSDATYMVLERDGNLRVYVYNVGRELTVDYDFFNQTQCNLPEVCGAYAVCTGNGLCECPTNSLFLPTNSSLPSDGCSYSEGPLVNPCSIPANVRIGEVNSVDYYSNRFSAPTAINITMTACKDSCMGNCSCTASFYNSESGACYSVSDYPLSSMRSITNSNLTAFVKISTAQLESKSSSNLAVGIGVGISGFVVVSLVALGLVVVLYWRKARLARRSREDEFLETLPGLPPRYSKKDLDKVTLGFTKKLGSGGFGTVYEGTLKDGSKIAVKKLDGSTSTKDFRAEMATLGSINHINLVRLKGFCADGAENMLVYEYMAKGSLDRWLFNNHSTGLTSKYSLDWETRFKIALGTACGLAYLHDESSERIIHLDIKPQNILLDEDFNPKVADFGLSKLLVDRDSSAVVTTMRGTPGYLAPEWLLQSAITDRTDVYSYGIVLLELVTGRKCLDLSKQDSKERYVPAWLLRSILQGDTYTMDVVDPRLNIEDSREQVTTVLHIALECIQEEANLRPSMREVVQMLEGFLIVPALRRDSLPQKYRFIVLDSSGGQTVSASSVGSSNLIVSSETRSDSKSGLSVENR